MGEENKRNPRDVRQELLALADEPYRQFHSRLVPGTEDILGVRIPRLWKLARELAKEEGADYLDRASSDSYEERILFGMVIGLLSEPFSETLKRLPGYMKGIRNWAECDVVCSRLKKFGKEPKLGLSFLKPYLSSKEEYEVRFAVVLLLDYYITEEYIDETLILLENVSHPAYYVQMAVAWALSVCYVKFPEKTEVLLEKGTLDREVLRMTLQKIVESNRVNKDTKNRMRERRKKLTNHRSETKGQKRTKRQ